MYPDPTRRLRQTIAVPAPSATLHGPINLPPQRGLPLQDRLPPKGTAPALGAIPRLATGNRATIHATFRAWIVTTAHGNAALDNTSSEAGSADRVGQARVVGGADYPVRPRLRSFRCFEPRLAHFSRLSCAPENFVKWLGG